MLPVCQALRHCSPSARLAALFLAILMLGGGPDESWGTPVFVGISQTGVAAHALTVEGDLYKYASGSFSYEGNFGGSSFVALCQNDVAVHAVTGSGDLYKYTGGGFSYEGNFGGVGFVGISQTDVAVHAVTVDGDLYKYSGGVFTDEGNFLAPLTGVTADAQVPTSWSTIRSIRPVNPCCKCLLKEGASDGILFKEVSDEVEFESSAFQGPGEWVLARG